MENLKFRYNAMQKALETLQEALTEFELSQSCSPKIQRLMRDAIIQRFEYCIDSFWKFFKIYLELNLKITIEYSSPKSILRFGLDIKLISESECIILLNCLSDRNLTSHTYNEALADQIEEHIPLYFITMKNVIERLCLD